MPDLIMAVDQTTLNSVIAAEEKDLQLGPATKTGNFGPFFVSASASAKIPHGTLSLFPPNIFRLNNFELDYSLSLSFGIDLNKILPRLCIPSVCVFGFCTPEICTDWPTISVTVPNSGSVTTTADFSTDIYLDNSNTWKLDIVFGTIQHLDLSAQAALLLGAIQVAVNAALLLVPLIGPFLAGAIDVIMAAFDVAALTGFLGDLLTLLLKGVHINVFKHDKVVTMLEASNTGQYPAVKVSLDALSGTVQASDKTELVLTGSMSFP